MAKVIRIFTILALLLINAAYCEAYTFVHKSETEIQDNTEVVGIGASNTHFAIGFIGGEIAIYDSQGNFLHNISIETGENYVFEFSQEGHLLVYPSRNESVYTISTQGELLNEAEYNHNNYHILKKNMWQTKTIGENQLFISETNFRTTVKFIDSSGVATTLFVEQMGKVIFGFIFATAFALFMIVVGVVVLRKKMLKQGKT